MARQCATGTIMGLSSAVYKGEHYRTSFSWDVPEPNTLIQWKVDGLYPNTAFVLPFVIPGCCFGSPIVFSSETGDAIISAYQLIPSSGEQSGILFPVAFRENVHLTNANCFLQEIPAGKELRVKMIPNSGVENDVAVLCPLLLEPTLFESRSVAAEIHNVPHQTREVFLVHIRNFDKEPVVPRFVQAVCKKKDLFMVDFVPESDHAGR